MGESGKLQGKVSMPETAVERFRQEVHVALLLAKLAGGLHIRQALHRLVLRAARLATAVVVGTTTTVAVSGCAATIETRDAPAMAPAAVISPASFEQVKLRAWLGRGTVGQAIYSPNGSVIVVASSVGVYLYSARTLELVHLIETGSWVWSVVFSPDGATLASGAQDGMVVLWGVK